ncbi:Sensor histidine kinase RcsC [Pseudomonas fluorescens]|nr:Sensor histidine kinase RcsC [Pseudomonas fluorescens]VVP88865.1 Sensor histidine kinase RcsC [Pseudomonas fluorescens]
MLRNRTGHDFKHYKRATVLRRLERRLQVTTQADLAAYLNYIETHAEEAKALLGDMLIGVTNFFRDREAFEALERSVFSEIFERKAQNRPHREEVRIWSAGCSSGEEAYSLAILAMEQQSLENSGSKIQLFATDVDERAIARGRAGQFSEAILTDVPPTRLRHHFVKEGTHFRINKEIRDIVLFAKHNILADPPFSQIDLIVCRNLMIYLDREVQREILQMFHFALRTGGYLFLGSSESADVCPDLFVAVDKRNRIYRAKLSSSERRSPSIPRAGYMRSGTDDTVPVAPKRAGKISFADVHRRALESAHPPSLIIDGNLEILHLDNSVGRFLRYVAGEVSRNLVNLIDPALRLELRTTLYQAQQSGMRVSSRDATLGDESVSLVIEPYRDETTNHDVFLVVFKIQDTPPSRQRQGAPSDADNHALAVLEKELHQTKLQLQETIEQSEVSSEELKASNEEAQAINEELRSATEELETSKEELQSINEELLTVNYELKTKVEETDKVNDYLSNLIASTDIATIFVDKSMRIRWFTPRATDIFNILTSDTGRSLLDITHRLKYPQLTDDAGAVFETLNIIEREVPSNDQRWYIARLLPYRSNENLINGTVLTFIDITKRRAAEESLRLGQERMRLAAESTHDFAIIVMDEQGIISDWNTGAEMIFGYAKNEVLGKYVELIFTPEDRRGGVPAEELRKAHLEGRCLDERWHVRKGGERFYCSGEVATLNSDSLSGYVKIARDLTGHKRMQEQQNRILKETQTSSHMKDEFFAVMSHELKHPLNLIQLNTEMLRRIPAIRAAERASKAVDTISDAVASQARIIDDLLDVARIRTGKLKLKKQPVELTAILEEVFAVASSECPEGQITLDMEPEARGVCWVNGDVTRLEQVIWNLLNNALKFSAEHPVIQIVVKQVNDTVNLQFVDNGVGLSEQDLERVFNLFSQATHQHSTHKREGLGIGLSLVRQLIEAHGGSVTATSAGIGLGCTFTVTLPLCTQSSVDGPAQRPVQAARLHGMKVLLIDDSIEILEIMKQLLEMEEAEVIAFHDPLQVVEHARDTHFDVIISDIGMPGMDGHQLIGELRKINHLQKTPAIALTGYGDKAASALSGFDQHLTKPVQYEVLIETIEGLYAS